MPVKLTEDRIYSLHNLGVSTLHRPGVSLPDDTVFEPPCSIKWMNISHSLTMGAFSYAVSGFYFACDIGRYCSFGEEVQIGRHPHPMHWISSSPFFYTPYKNVLDQELPESIELNPFNDFKRSGAPVELKRTTIGHDVWIGHGAFILPGISIGTGAVIAAQSVVTKDVPPYTVVAGSPAKVVRKRFSDHEITALLESKWWEFAPWDLKGASIDKIGDFVEFVKHLRQAGKPVYSPELICAKDI